ncbi:hypothetical protein EAS61_18930 [Bradyrhizobium zhanjiangense]|uniref:Uncharacterized protein n=1 Tax=Bradyrhizobium zhanjiangense TaxID=1325107 RepID=A0A4Q0QNH1_9BRAD|nr:hypothetical protein EAS61_18930 [Bradyrhizobium zhanjiangense]
MLSHELSPEQSRFLVRRGTTGWMVYDRERKGPALLKDHSLAEKLSKERAEQLRQGLVDGSINCWP